MTRLVVTGGRKFCDTAFIFSALDEYHARKNISVLIEGEASGLDTRARVWAKRNGIDVLPFPARWEDLSQPDADIRVRRDGSQYDAREGSRRNQRMIDQGQPDYGLVFPGGFGTADMKRRLVAAGIPFEEVI